MQQLEVNLTIPIPEDRVLVSKVELQNLKEQSLAGVYWSMKDLEKRVGKDWRWIKEHILYPTKFKEVLDVNNGGFVYYPQAKGEKWSFLASKMSKFLEENFCLIHKGNRS